MLAMEASCAISLMMNTFMSTGGVINPSATLMITKIPNQMKTMAHNNFYRLRIVMSAFRGKAEILFLLLMVRFSHKRIFSGFSKKFGIWG